MKDISIIIPVWNAVEFLPRCFDSILGQTWDHDKIEVILVDDGSTDGSGALCDDYAGKHPMFRVCHQENTGSPAAPRNRGIELATGEFIFFCDHDDYFGPEAVERMIAHARAWGSDVLLAKMGQSGGRDIPRQVFEHEQPKADLYASMVTSTLGPWKLFRRSLVLDHVIRFPEDCSFDDSVFTLHAMLRAKTISVANDYVYYYWVLRPDGGNVTTGAIESRWHHMDRRLRGLARLFSLVDTLADPERAELNMLPKIIREPFAATVRRLPRYERPEADRWAGELRALLRPHYSATVADRLRLDLQLMCAVLLQTEDSTGLCAVVNAMPGVPEDIRILEEDGKVFCEHLTAARNPVRIRMEIGPDTLRSILTVSNQLLAAAWDHGSLTLDGVLTLRSGRSIPAPKLELRLQNHRARDRAYPMSLELGRLSEQTSAGGRVITTVVSWRSVVSRDALEAVSADTVRSAVPGVRHRWDLDLIARANDEVRSFRISSNRKDRVFASFARGAMAASSSFFLPDATGEKNLSLWEVTPKADLSDSRVKQQQPTANVAAFMALTRNDYLAQHEIAQRIEGGRFVARAWIARKFGRIAYMRVGSFARRARDWIRRRLPRTS